MVKREVAGRIARADREATGIHMPTFDCASGRAGIDETLRGVSIGNQRSEPPAYQGCMDGSDFPPASRDTDDALYFLQCREFDADDSLIER